MHLCKTQLRPTTPNWRPTDAQLTPNWRPTAYSWAHKWPRVMMPFIKINRAAIISGWPLAFTSLRWPMRQRQMIGMLHPALKLLSWFFRWPLQNILHDNSGFGPRWNNSQTDIRIDSETGFRVKILISVFLISIFLFLLINYSTN